MPLVTINGEVGSRGGIVGQSVAQMLGTDYVDRVILAEAARRIGATVEALEEKEERPETFGDRVAKFLQRMLERSAVAGSGGEPYFGPGLDVLLGRQYEDMDQEPITRPQELDDEGLMKAMSQVIKDIAQDGNVVITGRASNMILADVPHALHVRTTAPLDYRVASLMEDDGVPRAEAERILQVRERARIWFFRRFFKVEPANSLIYHITINTGQTPIDVATEIVATAARKLEQISS